MVQVKNTSCGTPTVARQIETTPFILMRIKLIVFTCCLAALKLSAADSIQFTETDVQHFVTGDCGFLRTQNDTAGALFSASLTLQGVEITDFDASTPIRLELGNLNISGRLGCDPAYFKGKTVASFAIEAIDPNSLCFGFILPQNTVHFTFSWTKTTLTISGSIDGPLENNPPLFTGFLYDSIAVAAYSGTTGAVRDKIAGRIDLGGFSLRKPLYVTGNSKPDFHTICGKQVALHNIQISGSADFAKPALNITTPTPGQRWSNTVFTVAGKASDENELAQVWYQLNGAGWTLATTTNGWTNWADSVTLLPGTNWLEAYSVDGSGNLSATNSVSFVHVLSGVLDLRANGQGTISPNYSNAVLEIGKSYSLTATGVNGHVFTNWIVSTDQINSTLITTPTLNFVMDSNLTVEANFLDTIKPTLNITSPIPNQRLSDPVLTATGITSDNGGIARVFYQMNSSNWFEATTQNDWTNWLAVAALPAGTNLLNAYAVDLAGNASATNSVMFYSSNVFRMFLGIEPDQASNEFQLNLDIPPSLPCRIEASADLISWTTMTNFLSSGSLMRFRDPAATNFASRYYRVATP